MHGSSTGRVHSHAHTARRLRELPELRPVGTFAEGDLIDRRARQKLHAHMEDIALASHVTALIGTHRHGQKSAWMREVGLRKRLSL